MEEDKAQHAATEAATWRTRVAARPRLLKPRRADLEATRVKPEKAPETDQGDRLKAARARVEEATDAVATARGTSDKIVADITDAESPIMKAKERWIQGSNVQASASVNAEQVVVACAITTTSTSSPLDDRGDVGRRSCGRHHRSDRARAR